jgi:hypothetical protein
MVLQGFIHCLVEGHAKGNSWGGSFEASHLVIVNLDNCRQECRILEQPTAAGPVNLATMQVDFKKLAQILLPKFRVMLTTRTDTEPAFFEDLGRDMRMLNIPATIPSSVHYNSKFTKFICRHMAFLPSLSRSNMIVNLIRVYKVLSVNERNIFTVSVDRAKRGLNDWRTDARFYELLKKVYDGKLGRAPYGNNGMDLLLFQRHFVVHAGDHLKVHISAFQHHGMDGSASFVYSCKIAHYLCTLRSKQIVSVELEILSIELFPCLGQMFQKHQILLG